jgi:hypothetical protein
MHSLNNHETVAFLNKVYSSIEEKDDKLAELPMEQWPAHKLAEKIIGNMVYFKKISHQENFEAVKHGVICQELRAVGVHSVELTYTFEPTIFGQLHEYFHWTFEIEGEDVKYKTMHDDIDRKIAQIQEEDKYYNEKPGALRYNSLLRQNENIRNIFVYLKENLPPMEDDSILPICALLLMDLEKMSASRQYNFLSFQSMMNSENPQDKWTSCLIIEANYKKPHIVLKN